MIESRMKYDYSNIQTVSFSLSLSLSLSAAEAVAADRRQTKCSLSCIQNEVRKKSERVSKQAKRRRTNEVLIE